MKIRRRDILPTKVEPTVPDVVQRYVAGAMDKVADALNDQAARLLKIATARPTKPIYDIVIAERDSEGYASRLIATPRSN